VFFSAQEENKKANEKAASTAAFDCKFCYMLVLGQTLFWPQTICMYEI
jgi:hypothetical protein